MKLITGFSLVALLWLAIWGGFVAFNEYSLRSGTEVVLYVEQHDPHDIFRGDFVQLNFDISRFKVFDSKPSDFRGAVVYVPLSKGADGCYHGIGISKKKPDGLFVRGRVNFVADKVLSERQKKEMAKEELVVFVEYGMERFYIREGRGAEISEAMREAALQGERLKAKVMINRWGRPLIKSLVLKDREISI